MVNIKEEEEYNLYVIKIIYKAVKVEGHRDFKNKRDTIDTSITNKL